MRDRIIFDGIIGIIAILALCFVRWSKGYPASVYEFLSGVTGRRAAVVIIIGGAIVITAILLFVIYGPPSQW